jgi:8-oxo-dGTP pyrophosphatase MutT (NUDIX family)
MSAPHHQGRLRPFRPDDDRSGDQDYDQSYSPEGFWGRRGAGCLFVARDTGHILFPLRSSQVQNGGTWGTWGGAVGRGETPSETVLREAEEETMADLDVGRKDLVPVSVFEVPDTFSYYNFLALVPHEFEPDLKSESNWETDDYAWVSFGNWPSPLHPGVRLLLEDPASLRIIRRHAHPARARRAVAGARANSRGSRLDREVDRMYAVLATRSLRRARRPARRR